MRKNKSLYSEYKTTFTYLIVSNGKVTNHSMFQDANEEVPKKPLFRGTLTYGGIKRRKGFFYEFNDNKELISLTYNL